MLDKLSHFCSALLGHFSWQPPAWLRRFIRLLISHRRASAVVLLLLAALAAGHWCWRDWQRRQPKPVTVNVVAIPPGVTKLEKERHELRPDPIRIHFGESVARLEAVPAGGTPESEVRVAREANAVLHMQHEAGRLTGVRLDPPTEGVWRWISETQLAFFPKNDWPAARKYRVFLDRALFPKHVLLACYEVEVTTPAFVATMPDLQFYTDPTAPEVKQVVATIEFTHRVDRADLERHLAVAMVGESEVFKRDVPRFAVSYGPHDRVAYLRTSALSLPEREDFMRVTLAKAVKTTQGGAETASEVEKKVRVPDIYSFFRVKSATGLIARNNEGDPDQVLMIETTTAAKPEDIARGLRVSLLPKKTSANEEETQWNSPQEIDEAVLQQATELSVKLIPSDKENTTTHSFKISLESDGQLFITLRKGTPALGGFLLGEEYKAVIPVPELPREIEIQGAGGVLALSGERKLSIKSRGVHAIEYEIARVPAGHINHLVSQTRGEFQNPEFVNYRFNEENLARLATERQSIAVENRFKANYSAFDFSGHLRAARDGGGALQGLFFLKAREWRERKTAEENEEGDEEEEGDEDGPVLAERFILVTDLGMIVKENADGGRDVFLASIKTGAPLSGVAVEVLAKNGVPLVSGTTSPDGRVTFPSLGDPKREKQPVAFVARQGNDVAFMPYARQDRKLDLSRFDIGGVESVSGAELDAFVFTERGIYRPGDEIRIGMLVKQRDWRGRLGGLPLEIEVIDARGASVHVRKFALPEVAFAETSYQTAYESPTGQYAINVFLVRNGKRDLLLGSTSVHVKEFLPDRMKIESHLTNEGAAGWVAPEGIEARIALRNLYGTPATDRRVQAKIVLSPARFGFDEYRDFTFYDPLRERQNELKSHAVDLGEMKTDAEGACSFDLQLERFADATYALSFCVEGFEADSGRSVATSNSLLISARPFVVGFKAEGPLDYISMGSQRAVQWIAIDPTLKKIAVEKGETRLIERSFVSVLAQQDNGNWVYESVPRETVIRTGSVDLKEEGLTYPLPTDVPGNYVLELRGEEGTRLSSIAFSVVGRGAISRSLERNAELEVKLSRSRYATGDEIEISIVAPYTGSGLITIERDRVYAHAWFKADRTSSVQRIRVPEDFEGTGYVNVSFIRALDSKEVFMSPLSYAVVPFQANVEKRRLPIMLRTPDKAIPGEPFRIGYKTDRPARIAIFAVDQGILQVSDYRLPDPLAHFFRKAALMVETSQIVDLILPEFSILRSAAAFGGDGEARHLNPFKRVTEKPVVFWSGVIDADVREREIVYDVPDYFSGTLTVMAVAMSPDAVGSAERSSLVRGPFVLTPNVPTVVAPGDQFDVSVTVANGVAGSGENAEVRLTVSPSEHLEIVRTPQSPLRIPEGREASATFTVRARAKFGSASLVFRASIGDAESKLRSTLSVRPAVPLMTSVRSGNFTKDKAEVKIERAIHPDFRKLEATVAAVPLGLARGLDAYLKNYPNGCSEQITSGAFCRLALAGEADFGLSRGEINAQLEWTFNTLRRRQNDQGGFGYWAVDGSAGIDFVSVYVMHFLIEAKAAGFPPPQNVFADGLRHLQAMVMLEPHGLAEARIQAYAIYLLTREGIVTTNYVLNLRDYLDKNFAKRWPGDLAAVYLAGACALLKKSDDARRLIAGYKIGVHEPGLWSDFHSALGADSQYVAIVARHFPELLGKITAADFQNIVRPIGEDRFNTLSAAYAVLALKSYSHYIASAAPTLSISEISRQKNERALRVEGGSLMKRAAFSAETALLRFTAKNQPRGLGAFYQVVESGYDQDLPAAAISDGLEVFREFLGPDGKLATTAQLGEPITVRLRARTLKRGDVTNVAIVDLLPGGFEIAAGSLQPGVGTAGCDYVEVREDRAVFFGTVGPRVHEIVYRIKPTNRGVFAVPPVFAEAMYDRAVKARGLAEKITVIDGR